MNMSNFDEVSKEELEKAQEIDDEVECECFEVPCIDHDCQCKMCHG